MNRRQFLKTAVAVSATGFISSGGPLQAAGPAETGVSNNVPGTPVVPDYRYKIGVCDWMLLKRQKVGAFSLAREIGVNGVEVDMGSLGKSPTFDNHLADPQTRQQFLDTARRLDLEISSLAMSGFYAQSFAERPTASQLIQDCIDTMTAMKVKVAFLPLGAPCDLIKHPELRSVVVSRLKAIAPKAEAAEIVIGIETALDAPNEVKLLEDIGSPAIQSYFNFANAVQNGRDLNAELRTLGRDRICQIHCTDQDGVWLQDDPRIDMSKVKDTFDDMGWGGWLVIERSRSAKDPHNVKWNFGANAAYLKSIFQAK